MKQEQGFVLELKGNMAVVRLGRHENCTSCGACAGSQQTVLEALNELGAKPGQLVSFEMHEEHMLFSAFIVFVMPLLLAALGGGLGWAGQSTEMAAIIGAVLGFAVGLVLVKLFDRRLAKQKKLKPVIVAILN